MLFSCKDRRKHTDVIAFPSSEIFVIKRHRLVINMKINFMLINYSIGDCYHSNIAGRVEKVKSTKCLISTTRWILSDVRKTKEDKKTQKKFSLVNK